MKELVQRFNSFISFSAPVAPDYINAKFESIHRQNQIGTLYWSTKATRQQLISAYWFGNVIGHFVVILSLSILLTDLICDSFVFVKPAEVLLVSLISFPILLFFHYWPSYQSKFLPRLETIVEIYEHTWQKHLKDCQKAQWQNLTLVLIAYGVACSGGAVPLQPTDESAELLNKIFGVSPESLKEHLELLLGPASARKNLVGRKRTEVQNRFAEAYQLFEEWQFTGGIRVLKELESRVFTS